MDTPPFPCLVGPTHIGRKQQEEEGQTGLSQVKFAIYRVLSSRLGCRELSGAT